MALLLKAAVRYRWLVLALLTVLSLLAGLQLPDLQYDVSTESLVVKNDPAWDDYQRHLRDFGSESVTIVLLKGDALADPAFLARLAVVHKKLLRLPYVSDITSLFTVAEVRNEDGFISARPYLEPLPATREEARRTLERAADNPLVQGNLLSADGRAMAINLTIKEMQDEAGLDRRISADIEALIAPLREQLELTFQMGGPFVSAGIENQIGRDQATILPLSMLVLILVLGFSLKRLDGALVPAITAGLSVLWTLGLMAWLGVPLNVMTSIVPALLVIIGSTEDVHLLAEYQLAIADGETRPRAIETMANGMGTAILLTFVTTFLGFLSITVNDISLLRQFGLVAATGLLLNFLITGLTVPVYLHFFGSRRVPDPSKRDGLYVRLGLALFNWLIIRRLQVLIFVVLATLVAALGTLSLYINNSPVDYFKESSVIKQQARSLHENLAGMHSYSIVLETGVEDTFLRLRYLDQVHELQRYLEQSGHYDKSLSFADFAALVHRSMVDPEQAGEEYLPEDEELLREYMLFIKRDLIRPYVNDDFSKTRIIVRHNIHSSHELNRVLAELQAYIDENIDSALRVSITGQSILAGRAAEYMAIGQIKSLGLMVIIILGVVSVLFADSRAGLLALLPNLFPVILLFGLMGFLGIPLDTGTTMVAVVALGICVDDTVHFMSRYHRRTRSQSEPIAALRDTIRDEATPIMTTSVALAIGFSVLALSGFVPVVNFGLLSALVMLLALLATFVLTPVLLSYISLITMWEMLSIRLQGRVVNECPLFREMGPWSIKQTILASDVQDYPSGKHIIEQGEPGSEMYVILEGSVHAIQTLPDGSVNRLSSMGEGAVFGEIALVSSKPRTASVVAWEATRVLAMQWSDIRKLSRLHPRIAATVFRNLSGVLGERLVRSGKSTNLRDELTGAYTRPFLEEQMLFEIERLRRYGEPLCMAGVSVAYVADAKLFEELLLRATTTIEQLIRRVDVFARWAGRSFVILLPHTAEADALLVVQRIRAEVEAMNRDLPQRIEVHIRIAGFSGDESIEQMLARANDLTDRFDQNDS